MIITCAGTSSIGKTTFIKDFIQQWPQYSTPSESYRDVLKKKKLKHTENSNIKTQAVILEFLTKQLEGCKSGDNIILDRSPLDNLAYTAWLNLKGKVSDKFLDETRIAVRESLRKLDIIFYFPLTSVAPVPIVDDGFRSVDPVVREEIDNIFKVFQQSYHSGDGRIFPENDSPPIIEIYGNPEQRVQMTKLYIQEDGTPYGEEQSLIQTV